MIGHLTLSSGTRLRAIASFEVGYGSVKKICLHCMVLKSDLTDKK